MTWSAFVYLSFGYQHAIVVNYGMATSRDEVKGISNQEAEENFAQTKDSRVVNVSIRISGIILLIWESNPANNGQIPSFTLKSDILKTYSPRQAVLMALKVSTCDMQQNKVRPTTALA